MWCFPTSETSRAAIWASWRCSHIVQAARSAHVGRVLTRLPGFHHSNSFMHATKLRIEATARLFALGCLLLAGSGRSLFCSNNVEPKSASDPKRTFALNAFAKRG